jgi:RNA polymerase sigma factor (sigma-70 family)
MSFVLADWTGAAATDAELIGASLRDPDAFRPLFDRHYRRVHRYAAARVGEAADDVAADTFATAFDRRHRYDRNRPDAGPWLLGIAANKIRRFRRAEEVRLRALALAAAQPAKTSPPESFDASGDLARALLRLHRRDRDVLTLFALEGLSYAEIGLALGIPQGTVRSRLNRARRIVKEVLDP